MACWTPCSTYGPGKFAGLAGVIFDIAGCGAICGAMCANCIAIPGVCFSEDTTLIKNDGTQKVTNISDIKEGDLVLTKTHNENSWTRIIRNDKEFGTFNFVNIQLINETNGDIVNLSVTEEHEMILLTGNGKQVRKSRELQLGLYMLGENEGDVLKIIQLETNVQKVKYVLQTELGTVFANQVYTTTLCNNELPVKDQSA